ncbi:MAG: PHP domain-containing protein [Firmicutes bacterium]|jgi:histidinol phosphatase-like PHP family hydrolase|nr:PHP domain-containing protein [Bacillota bacterium]
MRTCRGKIPRVDLHVHSSASDGGGSVSDILDRAREKGLWAVAVTDHLDPYHEDLQQVTLEALKAALCTPRRVEPGADDTILLVGIERGPHRLDDAVLPPELGIRLDVIIASAHYLTSPLPNWPGAVWNPEYWAAYKDEVLRLATGNGVDVIGHMSGYLPIPPALSAQTSFEERRALEREIADRFFERAWYEQVFRCAAQNGVAVELHCATHTPAPDMVKLGLNIGVKFSIGSDAHSVDKVGEIDWAVDLLESLGAGADSVFQPRRIRSWC